MSDVNRVIILGNVASEPKTGNMLAFRLATNESWIDKSGTKQERVEYHNCKVFGKLAEVMSDMIKKGSSLYIEGKLSTSSYEKDGVKKYSTDVIVNFIKLLGNKDKPENIGYNDEIPF